MQRNEKEDEVSMRNAALTPALSQGARENMTN
jgi:hypothetical protein